jgi:hypothetical protein
MPLKRREAPRNSSGAQSRLPAALRPETGMPV